MGAVPVILAYRIACLLLTDGRRRRKFRADVAERGSDRSRTRSLDLEARAPACNPDVDWQQVVTCVSADAGTERWLLDPLLPPEDASQVWDRLAQRPPTAVAVLTPDHMRRTWGDPQIQQRRRRRV